MRTGDIEKVYFKQVPLDPNALLLADSLENYNAASVLLKEGFMNSTVGIAATLLTGDVAVAYGALSTVKTWYKSANSLTKGQKEALEEYITIYGLSFDENGNLESTLYGALIITKLGIDYNQERAEYDQAVKQSGNKEETVKKENLVKWVDDLDYYIYNDGYQMNLSRWEEEKDLKTELTGDFKKVQSHYINVYQK